MSYKVSVDSIADADADDVFVAFIDILFRQSSIRSWVFFGLGLFIPFCLSAVFWINGQFLGAAVFSATALLIVIGRIIGLSREKPAERVEQPEEHQVQAYPERRPLRSTRYSANAPQPALRQAG